MNRIVWFDVPVDDLARAIEFYSQVLDVEIKEEFPGVAVMTHQDNEVAGCLFKSDEQRPSRDGIMVYFNVNGRIRDAVKTVAAKQGELIQDVHAIGPFGFRAIVLDSEGNRIVLHSESDA